MEQGQQRRKRADESCTASSSAVNRKSDSPSLGSDIEDDGFDNGAESRSIAFDRGFRRRSGGTSVFKSVVSDVSIAMICMM